MRILLVAAMTAIAVAASQAAEKPADLKPGAGREKVVASCNGCHSLDYIPMIGGVLDVAGWNAEVAKMINAFGAPIDQADAKQISQYLGANYALLPPPAGPTPADAKSRVQTDRLGGLRPKAPVPKPRPHNAAPVAAAVDPADHGSGMRPGRE